MSKSGLILVGLVAAGGLAGLIYATRPKANIPGPTSAWQKMDSQNVPVAVSHVAGWQKLATLNQDVAVQPLAGWQKLQQTQVNIEVQNIAGWQKLAIQNVNVNTYPVQYSGYLASDGVHITIQNNSYDFTPNPKILNAAPANRFWPGAQATVYFPYLYYGSAWIGPGNVNVTITNLGTNEGRYGVGPYPYGIPIPPIGQSVTVVLPYELFKNASVYDMQHGGAILPSGTSAAEPNYPDDVLTAILTSQYTWDQGGNKTKQPTDNLPITVGRK